MTPAVHEPAWHFGRHVFRHVADARPCRAVVDDCTRDGTLTFDDDAFCARHFRQIVGDRLINDLPGLSRAVDRAEGAGQ